MNRACFTKNTTELASSTKLNLHEQNQHASSPAGAGQAIRPLNNNFVRMKNLIIISIIILSVFACKKTEFSPEGPTDVRVKNISDIAFTEVIVNTSGGIDTLGNISSGGFSEYFRFEKAFPKAEITAKVNGQIFSTGAVSYNGMTYIGQAKITYEVWISDFNNKKLEISKCIPDAGLD
jgi:hypothetical protein